MAGSLGHVQFKTFTFKKTLTAPFYGWGSTVSRLQSHYKETVYFLPLGPQDFLVLIQYSFSPRKGPWSHSAVLNRGSLDWESSSLTIRPLLFRVTHRFLYMSKHYSISVIQVRATDPFSAQSIFHSPSYTKCYSSFRTIKQSKSIFHSTSIYYQLT